MPEEAARASAAGGLFHASRRCAVALSIGIIAAPFPHARSRSVSMRRSERESVFRSPQAPSGQHSPEPPLRGSTATLGPEATEGPTLPAAPV